MSSAEAYMRKWKVQARSAMTCAVFSGEDIRKAAERIHRRYHRAMGVDELVQGGLQAAMKLASVRPIRFKWAPQCEGDGYGVSGG